MSAWRARECPDFGTIVGVSGLNEVLMRYPRRVRPLDELEFLGGAGGQSGARLWRFRSEHGALLLRAWPSPGPSREHLGQVHRWLSLTAPLGFIPAPIPDEDGHTLQELDGRFWELTPWLAGSAELDRPPAPERVRAAFSALAAFHQRLAGERCEGVSPGLGQRDQALSRLLGGGLDSLERAIERSGGPEAEVCRQSALGWVRLARIIAPRLREPLRQAAGRIVPLQPCLRDARPDHFLFEGDCVRGLVDFGAMGVDCVAGDLARLTGEWFDDDLRTRDLALSAYERIRSLDHVEAALIGSFASSSALLIGEHWIRWHYLEGRRFDQPQSVIQGIARSMAQLERLADTVIK
jgi:homoserine kinase type II